VPGRRRELVAQLRLQRIAHEVVFGADGLHDIPAPLLKLYSGKRTRKHLTGARKSAANDESGSGLDDEFLGGGYWQALQGNSTQYGVQESRQAALFRRMEVAAKLSFTSVFHKMVGERWEYMLVFEDDAVLFRDFSRQLRDVLCRMPDNFEVLYLNACHETTGEAVRPGVIQFQKGSCTVAFVVSLPFALRTIHYEVLKHRDIPFDHLAMKQGRYGRSFLADPRLVNFTQSIKSEIRDRK